MTITIVSIEDESEITELLTAVLEGPEVRLVTSSTAFDGLALVRELRPALLLLDIMLPDMDGWSVYDAVRADPVTRNTPVIMLTALRREYQSRRVFHSGPLDVYVTKPFELWQLRDQIENMLGLHLWRNL